MTTSEAAIARQSFVAGQVAHLGPLEFVLVGVPRPPFDAVQVLREEDGSLVVQLSRHDVSPGAPPYSAEQVTALERLGFTGVGGGDGARSVPPRAAVAPADPQAAATLVESVLAEVFGVEDGTAVDVRHGSEREPREAEARVRAMRAIIEPVLAGMAGGAAPVQDADGDYLLDIGHVRVFVAPRSLPGRPPPIIRVFAITNAGVSPSPELGLFLARLNFSLTFGRFSLDAGDGSIWFDETLLGEHVEDEELRFTVEMVASVANEWDEKLTGMFGGRVRGIGEPVAAAPAANKPGQGGYL